MVGPTWTPGRQHKGETRNKHLQTVCAQVEGGKEKNEEKKSTTVAGSNSYEELNIYIMSYYITGSVHFSGDVGKSFKSVACLKYISYREHRPLECLDLNK